MRESTFTNAICKAESKQISKDFAYCEDTISRQAAIDAADAVWSVTGDKNVAKVWDQIKDLPSVQQERKTGRWVERNPQNSPDCRLIECSECGNAYIVGYNIDYDDWIDGRNFCMKCGADLRGGNNGKNT